MRIRSLRPHRNSRRTRRQAHRPLLEPLEIRALLATITVDSTDDSDTDGAVLTLREAIEVSDGTLAVGSLTAQQQAQVSGTVATGAPGNTIAFDIPGAGVQAIDLTSALPTITVPVTIDGYTQPGSSPNTLADGDNAVPLIELDAGKLAIDGLTITAGDSTVRGLVIDGYVGFTTAIDISTEGGDLIEGDFLGPDPAGTDAAGTVGYGVQTDAPDNTIGGTTPAARNLLSVTGGTDCIDIEGSGASGNLVQGNFIGTNADGTALLDGGGGIEVRGAPNNTIGGTTAGARDVIAFDGDSNVAVELVFAGATGNLVQGNFIGIGVTGTTALGTQFACTGVALVDASGNTIGGTTTGAGNVISGLGGNDGSVGIVFGNDVGDTCSNNLVQGNFIGTDASGMAAVPDDVGIEISENSSGNTIGGTTTGAGNVISGNSANPGDGGDGITFSPVPGIAAQQNVVQGNFIGVNAAGAPLGNSGDGVQLSGGNTVGGTAAGAGNVIANNGGAGVVVAGATGDPTSIDNAILSNDIYANGALGIDLGGDGVTPNHQDGTGQGPNNLEDYPVITAVTGSGGSTTITGTLNSTPDESFLIQFFNNDTPDPSSFGEGQTYIGSIQTGLTDANTGDVSFTATLPVIVSPTQFVTATATDQDGNTSEFSEIDADLAVDQVASASTVAVGQDVTFTGTVTNAGPFAAPDLVLTDPLPAGFTFVSATGGATPQNGALSIPLNTLPVGSSTTVTVELQATTAGGPFTNTMSVTSAVIDPDTANNTAQATVNVTTQSAAADVSVQIGAMPDPVSIGQDLTYTITATNNGTSPATDVVLTDTLPAGVTFVSATGGATPSNGMLSFALGSLDVGASSTVTVVVLPTAAGTLSDSATVSADQTDPDPGNNTDTVTATVNAPAAADLSVGLAGTPDPVEVEQDLTYTITVANAGPSPATGVVLTDTLPAGVTFVSATGIAAPTGGVLTFSIGDLGTGADTSVTITVTPTTSGTLTDVAAVRLDQTDPDPANTTRTLSTTVVTPTVTQVPTSTTSPSATPAAPTATPAAPTATPAAPTATPAAPTATPTASPTPTTSSPTVLSVHRFGFHALPTKFVLTFDRPLDPAWAGDPAIYKRVNISNNIRPIRFRSATYDPARQSVTLRPMHRLYLYDHYRLTVADLRSMADTVTVVDPVDGGTTGGDFVAIITPADLVLTPAQRRDGPLMALIRSLAVTFPGLAHLVDGPAPRPEA